MSSVPPVPQDDSSVDAPAGPYASPPASPYAAPPAGSHAASPGSPYGLAPPPPAGWAQQPAYGPAPGIAPYQVDPQVFAHWGRRVGASVLDVVFLLPAWVVMITGIAITASSVDPDTGDPTSSLGLGLLGAGWLAAVVLSIWNRCFRAGRTGQSWGKKVVGIRLVRESDGQPVGVGLAFGRELAHVADSPFYLGYLWPLWDPKRQTFADKICTTVVLAR